VKGCWCGHLRCVFAYTTASFWCVLYVTGEIAVAKTAKGGDADESQLQELWR